MRIILTTCILLVSVLVTPYTVMAEDDEFVGPLVTCGTEGTPACGWCELLQLANNLIQFAIVLAVVIATLLFVYAGILYATSPGNVGNIQKAHRIFIDVLIGFIVILASYLIVGIVMDTLLRDGQLTNDGGWRQVLCNETPYAIPILPTDNTDAPPEQEVGNFCYVWFAGFSGTEQEICGFATLDECQDAYNRLAAAVQVRGCQGAGEPEAGGPAAPPGTPGFTPAPESMNGATLDPRGGYEATQSSCDAIADPAAQSRCFAERDVRQDLESIGVFVNKGFCAPGTQYQNTGANPGGCTDIAGLNGKTLSAINRLNTECGRGCLTLTGGSELGHSGGTEPGTHGGGDKVDLRLEPQLNEFLLPADGSAGFLDRSSQRTRGGDGATCYEGGDGNEYCREGDHWDVKVR